MKKGVKGKRQRKRLYFLKLLKNIKNSSQKSSSSMINKDIGIIKVDVKVHIFGSKIDKKLNFTDNF